MSDPISKIELKLWTDLEDGSGTDAGRVYLGIAGREYAVKSQGDYQDFQPHPDPDTYIFGEGANVNRPQDNDPRSPWPTDANDLTRCPMYIRFAPFGDEDFWQLQRADITVWFKGTAPNSIEQQVQFSRLSGGPSLWLGEQQGQFLYFPLPLPTSRREEAT
jgi:hypothetical protein